MNSFAQKLAGAKAINNHYTKNMNANLSRSFAPVVFDNADTLILGSMPGVPSLQAQQYYANPRNAFWPMIATMAGKPVPAHYQQRLPLLKHLGLALWDVIEECYRPGSLDSAINPDSVVVNDIPALLRQYPSIQRIAFNGRAAEATFKKHWRRTAEPLLAEQQFLLLPSSSPAHASLSFEQKLAEWRQTLQR
ncbi:DNA-deoxyinosine glycosylase [Permianibacter aggregans]|uniref:DNA-deoxyinosine glycosylase n=1 Tax=Permianibacter aggregans TaxID=1510150 RepID=UPI0018DFDE54|nr:DNA-deoxyinosine glycosylase [Permianibacter aggregans]